MVIAKPFQVRKSDGKDCNSNTHAHSAFLSITPTTQIVTSNAVIQHSSYLISCWWIGFFNTNSFIYEWIPSTSPFQHQILHHSCIKLVDTHVQWARIVRWNSGKIVLKAKKNCVKGESDPQLSLGRAACYHYTIDAVYLMKMLAILLIYDAQKVMSTGWSLVFHIRQLLECFGFERYCNISMVYMVSVIRTVSWPSVSYGAVC